MEDISKYLEKVKSLNISLTEKESLEQCILNNKSKIPIILDTYHLSNILGIRWNVLKRVINESQKSYYEFSISKKNGGKRKISMPEEILIHIQRSIKDKILSKIAISKYANGFVEKKSIIINAEKHLDQEMLLNIDLKSFFPSIHKGRVYYVFNKLCHYSNDVSFCLTNLVTYKNALPQGAPTSPIMSNIVAYMLDIRLSTLAKKLEINYTRYADDITFSGNRNKINKSLLNLVTKIVEECGFRINESKTRFANKGRRQEVTGLIVNGKKVNVPKNYIQEIRKELYFLKRFGIKQHREKIGFKNLYYQDHLLGKIMFVRQINEEKGEILLDLYNKIDWT